MIYKVELAIAHVFSFGVNSDLIYKHIPELVGQDFRIHVFPFGSCIEIDDQEIHLNLGGKRVGVFTDISNVLLVFNENTNTEPLLQLESHILLVAENEFMWVNGTPISISQGMMTPRQSKTVLDDQIEEAKKARKQENTPEFCATSILYDVEKDLIVLSLKNGCTKDICPEHLEGLYMATAEDLSQITLSDFGDHVCWEKLDVHFSVKGLVQGIYGTKQWMKDLQDVNDKES